MGDEQHRALGKPAPQGGLHLELRARVHGRCGLVQDEDLGLPEKGACQTQELLLAQAGNERGGQARRLCICTAGLQGAPTDGSPQQPRRWGRACVPTCGSRSTELVEIPILPFIDRATSGKSLKPTVPQFPCR